MKHRKIWGWAPALAVQLLLMALVSCGLLIGSLASPPPVSAALYGVSMWALIPLAGAGTAYLAVRKGLHYLLAWIAPALIQIGAQWALTGYLPTSPGMPMVTLFVSIIGAAAGEERGKRQMRAK